MKRNILVLFIGIACMAVSGAYAIPPPLINIHGSLTASDNSPLTGTRDYVVKFFNASVDGTQLGSDLTGTVKLTDKGLFNIAVEPPTEIFSAAQVWYELAIDSDATPNGVDANDLFGARTQVQKVPFAFQAEEVKHVDAANIGNGDVNDTTLSLLNGVTASIQTQLDAKAADADLTAHTGDTANPHSVTATQVGLGNVNNTADADKPISTATQTALDAKAASTHSHSQLDASDGSPTAVAAVNATGALTLETPAGQNVTIKPGGATGTNGQFLTTDGSGNVSWTTGGAGGGVDVDTISYTAYSMSTGDNGYDYWAYKVKYSGTIVGFQAYAQTAAGGKFDLTKNGVSVLNTPLAFVSDTVVEGTVTSTSFSAGDVFKFRFSGATDYNYAIACHLIVVYSH